MEFIDYVAGKRPAGGPLVSIHKRGYFDINREALDRYLKDVHFIRLRYAPEQRVIALKPQEEGEGLVKLRIDRAGRGVITAIDFFKQFNIDYSESRRFTPYWNKEQKQLEVQLKQEKERNIE